jgi:elongator complex protein 3
MQDILARKPLDEAGRKQLAIKEIIGAKPTDEVGLSRVKRAAAKRFGIRVPRNDEILARRADRTDKALKMSPVLERLLRRRAVRTLSGVAPVAVLTKPYDCPGQCAYCPTEKGVPQSYLSNEPAVMRAIRCCYDPYRQVAERLRALVANGHEPEKIELIVIGGSWSALTRGYRSKFIAECFRAANDYLTRNSQLATRNSPFGSAPFDKAQGRQDGQDRQLALRLGSGQATRNSGKRINALYQEQKRNERAKYRIIGVTVETRPDMIDEKEILFMRELGVTRVELGVQVVDDKILKLNRRGHISCDARVARCDAGQRFESFQKAVYGRALSARPDKTLSDGCDQGIVDVPLVAGG